MHYADYKSILSPQGGMNLYRGCTHGCIYCDSRSVCYQINHDFEDIEVLCRIIEPNVSSTAERFAVLEVMRDAGIPTVVWLCPILPFINDTEENLREILDYCIRSGVLGIIHFAFGTTMREGSRDYFYKKLDEHFPGMKQRYIKVFGSSYEYLSPNNSRLSEVFRDECRRYGILCRPDDVFRYLHTFEAKEQQISLFDGMDDPSYK